MRADPNASNIYISVWSYSLDKVPLPMLYDGLELEVVTLLR